MVEQAKLLITTALITGLVWWGADSLVTEKDSIAVLLEPRPTSPASNMLVSVPSEAPGVTLEIAGPRKLIEEIRSRSPLRIRLAVPDRPTGPGFLSLDRVAVRQALAEQRGEFGKLSVVSVQPDALPIVVDHVVSKDIALTAKRLTMAYEVEPQIQRPTASLRLRQSILESLGSEQLLQLEIGPDLEKALRDQPPGRSVTVTVPLSIDGRRFGSDAVIDPATAEVTVTLRSVRSQIQIPTVPILFAMSPGNLEKPLRVLGNDDQPLPLLTQALSLSGAPEDILRLQQGDRPLFGVIRVRQEDLELPGVVKVVIPEFNLPKGIEFANPPQPVEFKLVPVPQGPDGG